jgi:hypothetical protein
LSTARRRRRRVTDGKFFIAVFHVLWLFIGKKHVLSKKNFSKILEWNQYFPLYISYMRKVKTQSSRFAIHRPNRMIYIVSNSQLESRWISSWLNDWWFYNKCNFFGQKEDSHQNLNHLEWGLSSKNMLVFLGLFIRIAKRNNFVVEFFSIRALFRRENSIWKFKNNGFSGFLERNQPEL